MSYTLRELEAELQQTVGVISNERETAEGNCNGLYVWRDSNGEAYKWGPTPVSYELHDVKTVAEADLLTFLCPLCFAKNGGAVGTHAVMVSFAGRNVPDAAGTRDNTGKPSRWTMQSGTGLDDLVLTPSILLSLNECRWHGFVGSNGIAPGHAG